MSNKDSRAIKFRAFYKNKLYIQEYCGGFSYFIHNESDALSLEDVFVSAERGECVLQQFTGLLDKNGKEIYEGDIVDYRYDGMNELEKERMKILFVSPVYWNYERWRINYTAASYAWHLMEVVGNIFENPELCSTN